MKIITAVLALLTVSLAPAFAAAKTDEADRLTSAANVLQSLHATPDNDIPQYLWERAECVAVIPSVKKVAFVFGGEYGKGVVTCRNGQNWSAPAFVQLEKGSWGAQIGAEAIDLVLLVMNRQGLDKLLQDKVTLGAGASVAAGPVGRTARASTDLKLSAEILSYSRSNGIFAGVDLSGGVLGPDKDTNHEVYGANANAREILVDHAVKVPPAAAPFMTAVEAQSKPIGTTGRR